MKSDGIQFTTRKIVQFGAQHYKPPAVLAMNNPNRELLATEPFMIERRVHENRHLREIPAVYGNVVSFVDDASLFDVSRGGENLVGC